MKVDVSVCLYCVIKLIICWAGDIAGIYQIWKWNKKFSAYINSAIFKLAEVRERFTYPSRGFIYKRI